MIHAGQTERNRVTGACADDAELQRFVERSLGCAVAMLERKPLVQSTSFPCEVLTAQTSAGSVELFFKDFGSSRLPRPSGDGAAREIEVYRRILDPRVLGTPRHLGSVHEDGRSWLLLEHVRGLRLSERGSSDWLAAGAWLAELQLHAERSGIVRAAADCLVVHDGPHLLATAAEAVRALSRLEHQMDHRLLTALEDYEAIVERLSDQPRTLVHGSYRPENILFGHASARIAPVDWEHAALGCALYDVAFLSAGFDRARTEAMLAAFAKAAAERGLATPPAAEAWELVTILRLHKFLRSLGRAVLWEYPRETVEHLVTLAERLALELRSALRARARAHRANGARRATAGRESSSHPALRAWRTLGIGDAGTHRIRCIQGEYFSKKRVVYRMGPIGPGGTNVVAKRCRREIADLERRIYMDLLPRIGVSTPRCLGSLGEAESSWLFLDDVGARRLATVRRAQREHALGWLARLHLGGRRVTDGTGLPDRSPHAYLGMLLEARQGVIEALSNPALTPDGEKQLRSLIASLERIAAGWDRVAAIATRMPPTLVHGDFRPKNLYVGRGRELVLLPIDWEYSGWGTPTVDLGSLLREHGHPRDLRAYREVFEPVAPLPGEDELWTWVWAGRVLRATASIYWARKDLLYSYLDKPLRNLRGYQVAIERAFAQCCERTGGGA